MNKLNNPVAFIVVVMLFLALNGFLLYRYQPQLLPSIGTTQPATETYPAADEGSTDPSPAQEATTKTEEAAASEEAATTGDDANSGETATAEEGVVPSQETDALQTVVSVVEAPTWLSIQVDGQTVLEGVSEPGFSRQFEADREVIISTGDAGAVLVEINGYSLGALGASGEAATRTFRVGSET
jgi:cytoskeleton protein RodZ